MKTWLCTAPSNFFSPLQGGARLYTYVKQKGHDVSFVDLNQKAFFDLLSTESLELAYDRIFRFIVSASMSRSLRENIGSMLLNSSGGAMRQLGARGLLAKTKAAPFMDHSKFLEKYLCKIAGTQIKTDNLYFAILVNKDKILADVEEARRSLYDHFMTLPPETFISNYKILLCGKALIDTAYFPLNLDLGLGFHGTMYKPCVEDIHRAVRDDKYNFMIPYYAREIIPKFEKEQPELVGISITHTSDFLPAFTLAKMLKEKSPGTHICLGGATLTETAFKIRKNPSLWDYFDSLVMGAGEYAFDELISTLENKKSLSKVPNLVYKENGSIKSSEKTFELDLNDTCCPEYPFIRPGSVIPLETSYGCYWGKCMFCYYPKTGLSDINAKVDKNKCERKIELVLDDIDKLNAKYKPSFFGLTDSAVHPDRLMHLAEHSINSDLKFRFSAFIRLEKEFLSEEFCQKLVRGGFIGGQAGLESGSQRINDTINKGVDLKDAKKILKNFKKSGIAIHIYSLLGIPGETKKDAKQTYRFIKKMRKYITLYWQIYPMGVVENGPLVKRAEELGITIKPLPEDSLTQITMHEYKEGLSQVESVGMAIQYTEKLKGYLHPLLKILDVESFKLIYCAYKDKWKWK